MENHEEHQKSLIIDAFGRLIEFCNRYFTLSRWIFRTGEDIFYKVEIMMILLTVFCLGILLNIHYFPYWAGLTVCILLIQRILEFVIIYSRNFILNRGRIFTDFREPVKRGEWLILMFSINIVQIILIFAIWYRFLSLYLPGAFSEPMGILNSFYFSVVTFFTVGYGDIVPLIPSAKSLTIFQLFLTFYTVFVVVNGLVSIHFRKK